MNMALVLMLRHSTKTTQHQPTTTEISSNLVIGRMSTGMNWVKTDRCGWLEPNGGNQYRTVVGRTLGIKGYNAVRNIENQVVQDEFRIRVFRILVTEWAKLVFEYWNEILSSRNCPVKPRKKDVAYLLDSVVGLLKRKKKESNTS
ncbi:hypothetical protein Tco_0332992 [Tanacetum coccineum]